MKAQGKGGRQGAGVCDWREPSPGLRGPEGWIQAILPGTEPLKDTGAAAPSTWCVYTWTVSWKLRGRPLAATSLLALICPIRRLISASCSSWWAESGDSWVSLPGEPVLP